MLNILLFLRQGKCPSEAASLALRKIARYYPKYDGGLVAVNKDGEFSWLIFNCCPCCLSISVLEDISFLISLRLPTFQGLLYMADFLQVFCLQSRVGKSYCLFAA